METRPFLPPTRIQTFKRKDFHPDDKTGNVQTSAFHLERWVARCLVTVVAVNRLLLIIVAKHIESSMRDFFCFTRHRSLESPSRWKNVAESAGDQSSER